MSGRLIGGGSMLKPIPACILRSNITVKVCTSVDTYQKQTYETYTVKRVHVQPTNEIRKTQDNTDCTLRSILFVDARVSKPRLNWKALLKQAHDVKGDMRVIHDGEEYTVMLVDELRDNTDRVHHWEIALV